MRRTIGLRSYVGFQRGADITAQRGSTGAVAFDPVRTRATGDNREALLRSQLVSHEGRHEGRG